MYKNINFNNTRRLEFGDYRAVRNSAWLSIMYSIENEVQLITWDSIANLAWEIGRRNLANAVKIQVREMNV